MLQNTFLWTGIFAVLKRVLMSRWKRGGTMKKRWFWKILLAPLLPATALHDLFFVYWFELCQNPNKSYNATHNDIFLPCDFYVQLQHEIVIISTMCSLVANAILRPLASIIGVWIMLHLCSVHNQKKRVYDKALNWCIYYKIFHFRVCALL